MRCALFQTSANRSGEPAPSRFEDVEPRLLAEVDLAVDGGELAGAPSTVVDLSAFDERGTWEILREGALSRAEIATRLREAIETSGTP
jgi:tRNA A37 threonylcarbamoyladenosine synthetase subunit TsaC/SUA5/YrdC